MTQHTTEPWKVSLEDSTPEWSVITADGGRVVANVNEETGPELIAGVPVMRVMPGELNARRIVACVNALRGVPTEELERHHLAHAGEVRFRIEMTRQRDELLAAVGILADRLFEVPPGVDITLDAIRAAIAKAKGGAA